MRFLTAIILLAITLLLAFPVESRYLCPRDVQTISIYPYSTAVSDLVNKNAVGTTWATSRGAATGNTTGLSINGCGVMWTSNTSTRDSIYRYAVQSDTGIANIANAWAPDFLLPPAGFYNAGFKIDSVNCVIYADSGSIVAGGTGKMYCVPYDTVLAGNLGGTNYNEMVTPSTWKPCSTGTVSGASQAVAMDSAAIPTSTSPTKITFRSRSFTYIFDRMFHKGTTLGNRVLLAHVVCSYDYLNITPTGASDEWKERVHIWQDEEGSTYDAYWEVYGHYVGESYSVAVNPNEMVFIYNPRITRDRNGNGSPDWHDNLVSIKTNYPTWDSTTRQIPIPTDTNVYLAGETNGRNVVPISYLHYDIDTSSNWNNGHTEVDLPAGHSYIIQRGCSTMYARGLFDSCTIAWIDADFPSRTCRNTYSPWSLYAHTGASDNDSSVEISMCSVVSRYFCPAMRDNGSFDDSLGIAGSVWSNTWAKTWRDSTYIPFIGGLYSDSCTSTGTGLNVHYTKSSPRYLRAVQLAGTTVESMQGPIERGPTAAAWEYIATGGTYTYSMDPVDVVLDEPISPAAGYGWESSASLRSAYISAFGYNHILHDVAGDSAGAYPPDDSTRFCFTGNQSTAAPCIFYHGGGQYNSPPFPPGYEQNLVFDGGIHPSAGATCQESITITSVNDTVERWNDAQSQMVQFIDAGFSWAAGYVEEPQAPSTWTPNIAIARAVVARRACVADFFLTYGGYSATYSGGASRLAVLGNPLIEWQDRTYPLFLSYTETGTDAALSFQIPYCAKIDTTVVYAYGSEGESREAYAKSSYPVFDTLAVSITGIGDPQYGYIIFKDSYGLVDSTYLVFPTEVVAAGGGGAITREAPLSRGSWRQQQRGGWR